MRRIDIALSVTVLSAGLASDADAICREVEMTGSSPPVISPDQELLVIARTGVEVGCDQPDPADAGPPADAGAGTDAAAPDAGGCRTTDTVTWVVQPRFSIGADGARFALLMVTPRPPVVDTAPATIFEDLARATAPLEVVEYTYVEDASLGYQCQDPKGGSAGCGGTSVSGGTGDWTPPDLGGGAPADAGLPSDYVPVQMVGNYQVVVLAAASGAELAAWLDGAGYRHDAADIAALEPYLELGWTVTAVRVASEVAVAAGGLEPLAFTFEGSELRLPLAVSRQPSGRALLRVYLAAAGRYELAGAGLTFAGLTTPMGAEQHFLTASVLDRDLTLGPEEDPVPVRAAADTPYQESYTRTITTRVPSSACPAGADGGGDGDFGLCSCRLGAGPGGTALALLLGLAGALLLLRRRR